jgi:hypothetical protein
VGVNQTRGVPQRREKSRENGVKNLSGSVDIAKLVVTPLLIIRRQLNLLSICNMKKTDCEIYECEKIPSRAFCSCA